jgi:ketosteroid isomerase-like protein
MAESNVELHERLSEAWNAGDWDAVFTMYADDVVFEDNLLPDGGTYEGKEAVVGHFKELQDIGGKWRFETETILEAGDDVVWIGRTFGRLNENLPPYEVRTGAIFTYVDGRMTRVRWFATAEDTLAAAGLEQTT